LLNQIFEAGVHLHLDESPGDTSPGWLIEILDNREELFEIDPNVADGDVWGANGHDDVTPPCVCLAGGGIQ
jgi:hypothetical protein